MVFSETYRRRYDGKEKPGVGRGVTWEAHLIRTLLYETVPENTRIRAVTVADGDERHIPLVLRPYRRYSLYIEEEVDELCQWLLSPSAFAPPSWKPIARPTWQVRPQPSEYLRAVRRIAI